MVAFFLGLAPGLATLARSEVSERLGLVEEMERGMLSALCCCNAAFTILILIDWGVLNPSPWSTLVSSLLLAMYFSTFYFM